MAKGKKIGAISKKYRDKLKTAWASKYPLRYLDKRGRAMAVPAGGKVAKSKHIDLGGDRLTADQLQARRDLRKIYYITRTGAIMEAKSALR